MDQFVLVALGLSLAANAFFIYERFYKKAPPALSTDARQMLGQLASGKAVIEVKVIDMAGFFMRSPRG